MVRAGRSGSRFALDIGSHALHQRARRVNARRWLQQRILAGTAPHMEVLLHHYAFGKPTHKYVAAAPAEPVVQLTSGMTREEKSEIYGLVTRTREIRQAAAARSAPPPAIASQSAGSVSAYEG